MSALPAYEFDKAKDKENRRQHGLSLSTGDYVFLGLYFEVVDARRDYGETRLVAVGPAVGSVGDKLLSVTYTWRGDRRRFISVRQASADERRRYHHRHASYGGSRARRDE